MKDQKSKRKFYKKTYKKRKNYIKRLPKVNQLITKRTVIGKYGVNGSDTASDLAVSQSFALNDLASNAEFTSLFDQYQIIGIQYRFRIQRDPSVNNQTASNNQGVFPRLYWVHDHDDSSASFTLNNLVQYPKMKEISFTANKDCTRWYYLRPAVASQMYGPVFTGYSAKWKQWLDCGYPGTPHYGLKFYYERLYSGVQLYLDCKYIIKFKSVI